jgi:hypothetical protein
MFYFSDNRKRGILRETSPFAVVPGSNPGGRTTKFCVLDAE